MIPVTVFVIENQYGIKPFYYTDVNVGQKIKTKLNLENQNREEISIVEAYSTEEFVQLTWPNDQPFFDDDLTKDYSDYLSVKPAGHKHIFNAVFETDQVIDHCAIIHLATDLGVIIRVPLYYHVFTDIVKFLPSIVDFGVLSINFDIIRVPVKLRIREGRSIDLLYLSEVMLPLNDERIDFVMGDWDKNIAGNIQNYN
jgi:hypothetical protein